MGKQITPEDMNLMNILSGKLPNGKATPKKEVYLDAIAIAKGIFQSGKLEKMEFQSPEEPRETHVLNVWIRDGGDFDGDEVNDLSSLLGKFDYLSFEIQDDLLMIGCMIEDVYK